MELAFNEKIFPLKGILSDSMSDKEFYNFCQQNELFHIERDENKQIIIMPPTNANTGIKNANLIGELIFWNRKRNKGICFDSSTGFTLQDGSVRSPDASWLTKEKWGQLNETEKNEFPHICPDFVIELKSKSDNLKLLESKMNKWIENGCQLAWLINPENKTVFIYRKDGTISKVAGFDSKLSGEEVLLGFELDLSILND
ncbi:MAG: Uma2 family endonuclease [Ginsengibacter sp.]